MHISCEVVLLPYPCFVSNASANRCEPEPTNGTGSARQWRSYTPTMVAGLTDHVWTLREVLRFRVPHDRNPKGCEPRVGRGS
jgi:hypothetical protein